MSDPNRSHDDAVSRADAHAARQRAQSEALADLGITPAEFALFRAIYFGYTIAPSKLPRRGATFDREFNDPVISESECRRVLDNCLAKGWLQVMDEHARVRIADELRQGQVLGPIYGGLPNAGCVDFTDAGADLWRRFSEQCCSHRSLFPYIDVVHEKRAEFFRSKAAALAAIEEIPRQDSTTVTITGPTATGPWRAQWWRRFPEGYRIDIEERRQWQGQSSTGGEHCCLNFSSKNTGIAQLRRLLDRHNVTVAQWLMLESMDWVSFDSLTTNLCQQAANLGSQLLNLSVTKEHCGDALQSCLENEWLRVIDQRILEEVRLLLEDDPVLLAVPRIAQIRPQECVYTAALRRDRLVPVAEPLPDEYYFGRIDFSPAGAELYRRLSTEWLGPDWEDNLTVSRGYYWEEHHYCEAEEGFEGLVEEHLAKGNIVQSRVVPIGAWCVRWWQRFSSGYRLELKVQLQ